jgi:hypothetical protein
LLHNGLIVLIGFRFDEFRIVGDRASKTSAEIFAGFGFNIEGIPTRWGSQLIGNIKPILTLAESVRIIIPTRWGSQLIGNKKPCCRNLYGS